PSQATSGATGSARSASSGASGAGKVTARRLSARSAMTPTIIDLRSLAAMAALRLRWVSVTRLCARRLRLARGSLVAAIFARSPRPPRGKECRYTESQRLGRDVGEPGGAQHLDELLRRRECRDRRLQVAVLAAARQDRADDRDEYVYMHA